MDNGHNPMRWDCSVSGCFNKKKRPKIEVFHDCFPGRICFGDVDGIVEVSGKALVLEWKDPGAPLQKAQEIMWKRLTNDGIISVIVIEGDAETMLIHRVRTFFKGVLSDPMDADLEGVKDMIRRWHTYAKGLGCRSSV